jgi:hypothetical protein
MAKSKIVKKVEAPVAPPKPQNITTRWAKIQGTRKRNNRTGEPTPGSLGVAFLYTPKKATLEKVAVLTRDDDGKVRIQRAIGNQFYSVGLSFLRTNEELWDALKRAKPDVLPKNRIEPYTNKVWDPSSLTASNASLAFMESI